MPVNYEKVVEIVRLKQVVCESTLEMQKITSSFGIAQWLMDEIGNETQEVLMLLCLNTKNEVNSLSVVHRGTINQSIAHPRDIFGVTGTSVQKIAVVRHEKNKKCC